MSQEFFPAFMLVAAAGALALGMVTVSHVLGYVRHSRTKLSPYECGMPIMEEGRKRASIHFYVVAMLFILFDIEAAFLYPWAVLFRKLGLFGFVEMLVFVGVLVIGYIYCWRRGGLQWE
jgi:NADH-quinone oxidoreductase subunit A